MNVDGIPIPRDVEAAGPAAIAHYVANAKAAPTPPESPAAPLPIKPTPKRVRK